MLSRRTMATARDPCHKTKEANGKILFIYRAAECACLFAKAFGVLSALEQGNWPVLSAETVEFENRTPAFVLPPVTAAATMAACCNVRCSHPATQRSAAAVEFWVNR